MTELEIKNKKLLDDISRLVDEVVSLDELKELLATGKKLTIKYGVDCTAPFLHLGHAVNLWVMRRFQEDGHKVIFLIGNFTSKIGDPSGRSTARKVLTDEEIEASAQEFIKQVGKVLITDDPNVFEIKRNADWFSTMPLADFIGLCSLTTHSKLISRDMFKARINAGTEIYMNEILYPILQGYDSVMLDSDLTVVGSDQLFNEMMGRSLQERFEQSKQVVMTTKITKGLWGEEKQSKSIGNFVALTDTSKDMFGKIMTLSDERIIDWLKVYTDVDLAIIDKLEKQLACDEINPRDAKLLLASAVVEKYYGKDVAEKEKATFLETFSDRQFPADAPVVKVDNEQINIMDLLSMCYSDKTKSDLRRLIAQGAVSINDQKVKDHNEIVKLNKENEFKVGKRGFFKIVR